MYGRLRNGEGIDLNTGEGTVKAYCTREGTTKVYRIEPGADLAYAVFEDKDLALANLPWANMSHTHLSRTNLQGANLERANLENAKMWGVNLMGANLQNADLKHTVLKGANLAYANLTGAEFSRHTEMDSTTNLFRATVDPEAAEIIYLYTEHPPERLQLKITGRTPNPSYGYNYEEDPYDDLSGGFGYARMTNPGHRHHRRGYGR